MSILEFVESLANEIYNPDISIKENALIKLSNHVKTMSYYSTNRETVDCLLNFYVNLLTEHYNILEIILNGIYCLINFVEFSDSHAKFVAKSMVQIDVAQLKTPVRLSAYSILEHLFIHHPNSMSSLDAAFIREYMIAVSGENDPQGVLKVMRINSFVAKTLSIDSVYEELFENISVYYPVEFKTSKSSGSITREQIVEANKISMLASPLFGPQLFPTIMDKLSSNMKSAIVDSLDILADAFELMNFEDVINYYMSFQSLLYHQYKNRDPEIQKIVGKCLMVLSEQFQRKATETQLLEFTWHLFELCQSIINNDRDALQYILLVIKQQSRIWCAYLAYFLPKVAEKLLHENLEDLDRIEIFIAVLSSYDDLSQFKGLMDNINAKHLFTKATLLYSQMDDFSGSPDENRKMTNLFQLLSLYSLFDIVVPDIGSNLNFVSDHNLVIQSQVSLVSKAINKVSATVNEDLETALIQLVPRMVQLSADGLVTLIRQLANSDGTHGEISYRILRSFPVSCLGDALDQCYKGATVPVARDDATACLAVIVEKYSSDRRSCDQIYDIIVKILDNVLERIDTLSVTNVENLALAIAQLGPMTDESSNNRIIDLLLGGIRTQEPSNAIIILLCCAIGRTTIETIKESIKTTDLLYMLLGLLLLNVDSQVNAVVSQTFASLVNKSGLDTYVEQFVLECLSHLKENGLFLLCLLKACVNSGQNVITTKVIEIITDQDLLISNVGKLLSRNIDVLSKKSIDKNHHFCTDEKLFPKQALFYEQQIYYLLAQKYHQLTINDGNDKAVKDLCMELYLKMISGFSEEVLELSMDEVMGTIVRSLPGLSSSEATDKVDLQLQVLTSLSHLKVTSESVWDNVHVQDIAMIIGSVARHMSLLSVVDRLSLAKSVSWFLGDLIVVVATEAPLSRDYLGPIRTIVAGLLRDKKRVVRLETNKAKMLLEYYEAAT